MIKKTSAHYQREYRKRLREQGLVKREVWIRPENIQNLNAMEKQLRALDNQLASGGVQKNGVFIMTSNLKSWSTSELLTALGEDALFLGDRASIELIEGVDPAIHMVMHDYGDLPIFLTVSGEQIIVEAVLWETSEVRNVAEFNETILRTHKYFPLSTISLDLMADGVEYYHMFGALSSASLLEHIVFEIEVLASNVIQATSAYGDLLKTPIAELN